MAELKRAQDVLSIQAPGAPSSFEPEVLSKKAKILLDLTQEEEMIQCGVCEKFICIKEGLCNADFKICIIPCCRDFVKIASVPEDQHQIKKFNSLKTNLEKIAYVKDVLKSEGLFFHPEDQALEYGTEVDSRDQLQSLAPIPPRKPSQWMTERLKRDGEEYEKLLKEEKELCEKYGDVIFRKRCLRKKLQTHAWGLGLHTKDLQKMITGFE